LENTEGERALAHGSFMTTGHFFVHILQCQKKWVSSTKFSDRGCYNRHYRSNL